MDVVVHQQQSSFKRPLPNKEVDAVAERKQYLATSVTKEWLFDHFHVVKQKNFTQVISGLSECGVEDIGDLIALGLSEATKKRMKNANVPDLVADEIERFAQDGKAYPKNCSQQN